MFTAAVGALAVATVLWAPTVRAARGRTGAASAARVEDAVSRDTFVYVASTATTGGGIHLFKLQTENLEVSQNITLVPLGLAADTARPSFLEVDAARRFLFATNEIDEFEGKPTGTVTAFAIDPATGKLTPIDQRPSMGRRPCYLALDKAQQRLLVANCGSGGLAVLPVGRDGRLGEATSIAQAADKTMAAAATKTAPPITSAETRAPANANGDSASPSAAETRPRTHCLTLDPANRFAIACDFAGGRVQEYAFDAARGALTSGAPAVPPVKAGTGPEDIVFRPDGQFVYVANAVSSTVSVFSYDAATGALKDLQTVSTVPPYFDGANAAAELAVHPSGKYLYVSNRGHNSVVLFSIAPDTGQLTYVEEQGTGGVNPVHFGIEPSAKHLAIANQGSNTVLVCRIDAENGRLKPSGVFTSVPSPVFVKFLPPAGAGQ